MPNPLQQDSTSRPYPLDHLSSYPNFLSSFTPAFPLGTGGDGTVTAYQHTLSTALIAVKTAVSAKARPRLIAEMKNMQMLGTQHAHIVAMVAFCADFGAGGEVGPAVFLDVREMGDLGGYMERVAQQERGRKGGKRGIGRVQERTVWKVLRDVGLGLEYMHHLHSYNKGKREGGGEGGYLHNDIKPGNILVSLPPDWKFNNDDGGEGEIPAEPIFQLTDFSRMTPYPASASSSSSSTSSTSHHTHATPFFFFPGTPEYAPPPSEQHASSSAPHPASDMYSLGATLQTLALRIYPTQSRESLIQTRKARNRSFPDLTDDAAWAQTHWRCTLHTVYRPLSVPHAELRRHWDFRDSLKVVGDGVLDEWGEDVAVREEEEEEEEDVEVEVEVDKGERAYSKALEAWYRALWEKRPQDRMSARMLRRFLVPRVEGEMRVARCVDEAEECFERARRVRGEVRRRRVGRKGAGAGRRHLLERGCA